MFFTWMLTVTPGQPAAGQPEAFSASFPVRAMETRMDGCGFGYGYVRPLLGMIVPTVSDFVQFVS